MKTKTITKYIEEIEGINKEYFKSVKFDYRELINCRLQRESKNDTSLSLVGLLKTEGFYVVKNYLLCSGNNIDIQKNDFIWQNNPFTEEYEITGLIENYKFFISRNIKKNQSKIQIGEEVIHCFEVFDPQSYKRIFGL